MSNAFDTKRDRAATEAATWLVLLAEDPDDRALAADFDAWKSADPINAELWARTVRAHLLAGKTVPHFHDRWSTIAAAERPQGASASSSVVRLPGRDVRPRHRQRLVMTALAVLAAGLLLLAAPGFMVRLQADHLTATAEMRALELEDGTQVKLGPESALAIDFTSGGRGVRLLKGEAMFDVVPDAARPFRVEANGVRTTVLGTSFEVRLNADEVGVAVRHGRVQVDGGTPQRSEQLAAGQWIAFRGAAMTRGERKVDEIGDWLDGEIVARDRPVTEIVDALRRYYGGQILIRSDAFARTQVTGIYDLRHPDATLASLASSHDATMRRLSPWLLVVTAR